MVRPLILRGASRIRAHFAGNALRGGALHRFPKGCILFGRFTFADEGKNAWRHGKEERARRDIAPDGGSAAERPPGRDPAD